MLKNVVQAAGEPKDMTIKEISIPGQDGAIEARAYVPLRENEGKTFPVVVDFHGGAFIMGNLDSDELSCRKLCATHGVTVFNVNYRHAPDFPWPAGINDGFDATKWISKHAGEFKGDIAKGFIVNGASAGAFLAEVVAQRARDDPEMKGKITGQLLMLPAALGSGNGYKPEKYKDHLRSYEQGDAILTPEALKLIYESYKGWPSDDHPYCSPLLTEPLSGLPAAYFQIAGGDVFRDEGLLYAQLLEESGVPTKFDVYPGLPHGFSQIFPELEASKKWHQDNTKGMQWLLSQVQK